MAYALNATKKLTGMMWVVTSGHPAEFAELGPVIAQSVTPRANACCVSPNDNVTGIPPRLSIRSASVLSPTRTFLPLMSASPEMAPWQNNTCGPKGQRPSNLALKDQKSMGSGKSVAVRVDL